MQEFRALRRWCAEQLPAGAPQRVSRRTEATIAVAGLADPSSAMTSAAIVWGTDPGVAKPRVWRVRVAHAPPGDQVPARSPGGGRTRASASMLAGGGRVCRTPPGGELLGSWLSLVDLDTLRHCIPAPDQRTGSSCRQLLRCTSS